jgi:hypothetical protein
LQIVSVGISLLILAWIALTSINVIVANRTIANDRLRLEQTQALYAAQIKLIDDLQAKQNSLAAIMARKEKIDSALRLPFAGAGRGGLDATPDEAAAIAAEPTSDGSVGVVPQNSASPPPEGFLRRAGDYLTTLFGRKVSALNSPDHPAPIAMQPAGNLLTALDDKELMLLRKLTSDLESESGRLGQALQNMGIMPESFMGFLDEGALEPGGISRVALRTGSDVQTGDPEYFAELANAADELDALAYAVGKMNAVPWLRPTDNDYRITSPFGVRRDPFSKRRAFHAGLDLSGPRGSLVRATAPGIVIYAARKGGYGNTVEIDHGSGIRTRYGHLRSISVRVGAAVDEGTPVGRLGSTGRSTGPHVHYEVWYGNTPKDPQAFIEAGQILLDR